MDRVEQTYQFGRWIRKLRERLGKTQREVADLAGITPSFLSHLENEKREASASTLVNILEALGVSSLSDFFAEVERKENPVHRVEDRVNMVAPNQLIEIDYLGPRNRSHSLEWMCVEMKPGYVTVSHHLEGEDAGLYVLEGKLGINIDGEDYEVNPGELCFIGAGCLHKTRNLSENVTRILLVGSKPARKGMGLGRVSETGIGEDAYQSFQESVRQESGLP